MKRNLSFKIIIVFKRKVVMQRLNLKTLFVHQPFSILCVSTGKTFLIFIFVQIKQISRKPLKTPKKLIFFCFPVKAINNHPQHPKIKLKIPHVQRNFSAFPFFAYTLCRRRPHFHRLSAFTIFSRHPTQLPLQLCSSIWNVWCQKRMSPRQILPTFEQL